MPEPPVPGPKVFTDDPVRVSWVVYGFIQAVVTVLLLASIISEVVGGVITGLALAAYVAVSELFVRPATVPREPLAELAAHQEG
jgi:hypothetical protein